MKASLLFGAAGVAMACLLGPAALAQPAITAVSPAANLRNAPRSGPVTVSFSQPLGAGSMAALKVFGSQRGGLRTGHSGATTASGNTLTFVPDFPFLAGETIRATLTTAAQNASGQPLAQPRLFSFVAAAVGGTGVFAGGADLLSPNSGGVMVTGDMDNDGDVDVLITASNGYTGSAGLNGILLLRNNGDGTFTGSGNYIVSQGYGAFYAYLALADMDGDGDLDLLHDEGTNRGTTIRWNDGTGNFPNSSLVGAGPLGVPPFDVDGDGDLDLFHNYNGVNEVLLNNGAGAFPARSPISGSIGTINATGDVDGDGDVDVVSGRVIQLNNGRGVFAQGTAMPLPSGTALSSVALGDVDGDNDLDLVTSVYMYDMYGNTSGFAVEVRLNNGSGVFSVGSTFSTTVSDAKALLADVDGDGDLDILAHSATGIDAFLNNGSGSFAPGASTPLASRGGTFAVADLDQDGDIDLVAVTRPATTWTLSTRLNQNRPLATRQRVLADQISIVPNPAHQRFAVVLPALPGTAVVDLTLRNALGQVVLRQQLSPAAGARVELSAAGLAPGLYLLGVQAGAEVFTKRLMLE